MVTEQRGTCRPSRAELCQEQAANCQAGSRMIGSQPFGKAGSRQGWRGKVGKVSPMLALGMGVCPDFPGWSKCLWPFLRLCVFFIRWGTQQSDGRSHMEFRAFQTMGSACIQSHVVFKFCVR